uniref:Acyl-CoA synthetase short-chain family member 3, mitochondrial n=1 Tax=Pavo cristatus TaxID=9049 RepID=A0A8C9ET54_PAVCR
TQWKESSTRPKLYLKPYLCGIMNTERIMHYRSGVRCLYEIQVSKLADVMVRHGVKKGDRVVIYMPMIPQTVCCMLACARIGAIHSLIFGGFASKELSVRIDHAKVIHTWNNKHHCIILILRLFRIICCFPLRSEILYSSLTGVIRPTGGYAVMLNWTMSAVYGLKPGEVWWAASDLGWVVGHSYICYGPLLHGNPTVLYEGKPVGTPDAGAYFRVLAEHEVAAFFTSPTAIRAIRQQDPEAALGKQYSLKSYFLLTESGSPITASCVGLGNSTTPPPGQAGKPVPGYNVMILDENKEPVKATTLGNIVVKLPLPPGAFSGLWENQEAFHKLYFQKFPCILHHHAVADCAVVGQEDALKGHVPFALCVLRDDIKTEEKKILEDIVEQVRNSIGPVAAFQKGMFVKQLPKTRSGKIPRSALSALVSGKPYKITPTIEDASVFKHIEEVLKKK